MKAGKRYFTNGFINAITFRAPDRSEQRIPRGLWFDTWAEAHAHLLERREKELAAAKRNLSNAEKALARCRAMRDPNLEGRQSSTHTAET